MSAYESSLHIKLLSDTTPGRGEGTAGEVDIEIDHDDNGLPVIRGKTLHGLLLESWLRMAPCFPDLWQAGLRVWGLPGDNSETAILRVGDAGLPMGVQRVVQYALQRSDHPLTPAQILRSLTDIRWQTAQSRQRGAPEQNTLRSVRVLVRGLTLIAPLTWLTSPSPSEERCLALSVLGLRQLGTGGHRGRGYVQALIEGDEGKTRKLAGLPGNTLGSAGKVQLGVGAV